MPRYAKPHAGWSGDDFTDDPLVPGLSVDDHQPVKTGLFYPDGQPIMRLPNPIGFGRDEDW